ncbi:hypothetical protein GCM10027047_23220 [Rhodococcus aerolatus]
MSAGHGGRLLRVHDRAERDDLATFVGRVVRLDDAAVVRLRRRAAGTVAVYASTGFDALAARVVRADLEPADTTVNATDLLSALAVGRADAVDPGFAVDAAWRSALPPEDGFHHVDDVPARVLAELAERGVALAREHAGPQGPPPSLLDQAVLTVAGSAADGGAVSVEVPMRCVFALQGMGFVGEDAGTVAGGGDALVRVRASAGWLRLDARYGSVLRRRHPQLPLLIA